MTESAKEPRTCFSCHGTGEIGTEVGPADCPDCGGAGTMPSRATLTDWRARDIERRHTHHETEASPDVRWLVAELRRARSALTQIAALAMDGDGDDDAGIRQIRGAAFDALGLYETVAPDPDRARH